MKRHLRALRAASVVPAASRRLAQRGFTLVEVLVALLVLAFGMMALAGFQTTLSQGSDLARQRTEATRLAQERMEALRSFEQITTASGKLAWQDLASGSDIPALTSNTAYARSWALSGGTSDAWRRVAVSVAWQDRSRSDGSSHLLTLNSMIARSEPASVGALALASLSPGLVRRPKSRSLDIPWPATSIGGGRSTVAFEGGQWLVFNDATGVVQNLCATQPTFGQTDFSACTSLTGYLLGGSINDGLINQTTAFAWTPDNATTVTALQFATAPPRCVVRPAADSNNGAVLPDYLQYLCLIEPGDHDGNADTPPVWSGRLSLQPAPLGTQKVCRYNYDAVDAAGVHRLVARNLLRQDYLVTAAGACPAGTSQHQP
jgi:type IV pilus modification protein PilV